MRVTSGLLSGARPAAALALSLVCSAAVAGMGLVFFADGMVLSVAPDGRVEHVSRLAGLTNFGGEPLSADHPPMENA